MSMCASEMTPADIAAVTGGGNCNNGVGWGGAWGEWILVFLIFAVFGWGGMGFGGGFGGFGGGAGMQGALTRSDLCSEFNFNGLENSVRGIQQGICDSTYALNNSILTGFHGVDNAICNLGYTTQQGFNAAQVALMQAQNALQTQAADCCCKNQVGQMQIGNQMERGFCDANYAQATNTNAIIQNAHNDTDRVLAKLDAMEMSRKDETIATLSQQVNSLQLAASQAAQNNYLVNQLRPCPVPAYITCNPYTASYGVNPASYNNGCGCNSCCG